MKRHGCGTPNRQGFTLLELLVVMVLLVVAAAVVVPALRRTEVRPAHQLAALLPAAREAAARRGETVHLRITRSGEWRMVGATASADEPIAVGHVDPFDGLPLTVIVSPLGSCALDARSSAAAASIPLEPITCEMSD